MAYNGYKNYETWLFMVHFGDYLYEYLKEQQEYDEVSLNYQTVYNTVNSIINEMHEDIKKVSLGSAFLSDLLNPSLSVIDVERIADLLYEDFKEEE